MDTNSNSHIRSTTTRTMCAPQTFRFNLFLSVVDISDPSFLHKILFTASTDPHRRRTIVYFVHSSVHLFAFMLVLALVNVCLLRSYSLCNASVCEIQPFFPILNCFRVDNSTNTMREDDDIADEMQTKMDKRSEKDTE